MENAKRFFVLLVGLTFSLVSSLGLSNVDIKADVVYGHKDGMALVYDVLQPTNANGAAIIFMMSGVEIIQSFFRAWTPQQFVESVAELSFLTNFTEIAQGVIDIRDIVFFLSVIGIALFVNTAIVEAKKGV